MQTHARMHINKAQIVDTTDTTERTPDKE